MSIERIEKKHLRGIAELETLCFASPWSEQALELLLSDSAFGMVSAENEKVYSYASLSLALDEGEILNVATHPSHQRQGHARRVLLALMEEAKQRGLVRLTLEVRDSNLSAQNLYASLGFSVCGRRKDFYRFPREDALIMEKTIE
jgi:ribosomal-protein-alanine N-acetyltransferase